MTDNNEQAEVGTGATTRAEQATDMRRHYDRVSVHAADWHSGIVQAIDAWERQPDLERRLAAAEAKAKLAKEVMVWLAGRPIESRSAMWADWLARYDALDAGGEG